MKLVDDFKRRQKLKKLMALPDGKVWRVEDYNTWGYSIQYSRSDDQGHHWHGFLSSAQPQPGDLFETTTRPGDTVQFKVLEVRRCVDPDDMFFVVTSKLGRVV